MALNAPMKGEICAPPQEMTQCRHCGAVRTTLYNIESNALVVPLISAEDFSRALGKAHSSVGVDELQRFIDWTEEFGQVCPSEINLHFTNLIKYTSNFS